MAGFMSPSLGFASTLGSAISGGAKQLNQNIDQERVQAHQDDVLDQAWAAKANDSINKWSTEQKQYNARFNSYNNYKQLAGGNEKLAEMAAQMQDRDPKLGTADIVNFIRDNKDKFLNDGYKSDYNSQLANEAAVKVGQIKNIYNSVRPKYQRLLNNVEEPNFGQTQGQTQVPSSPFGQPSGIINENTNPPLNTQINSAPSSGEIPLDTSSSSTAPSTTYSNGNTQVAQNGDIGFTPKSGITTPHQAAMEDIARNRNAIASQNKPPSFDEQEGTRVVSDDIKHYLHDPKNGLQLRINNLDSLRRQNYEMSSMMDVMDRGFKSNAVQPLWDSMNYFTKGALGVSLDDLGIPANSTQDYTLMRKNIANAVIDRLATLHFGRITNYEAQTVREGLANNKNDPNTNLKIILTMKKLTNEALEGTPQEYNAVYKNGQLPMKISDQNSAISEGRKIRQGLDTKYNKDSDSAPWPQISGNQFNPEQLQNMLSTKYNGQWVEDKSDGSMYMMKNGRLYKAGDKIDG